MQQIEGTTLKISNVNDVIFQRQLQSDVGASAGLQRRLQLPGVRPEDPHRQWPGDGAPVVTPHGQHGQFREVT